MKIIIVFMVIGFISLIVYDYNYKKEIERIKYNEAKNFFIENELNDLYEKNFTDVGNESDCTQDCSGHIAGFEWAKQNDIWKIEKCTGHSTSFVEGCQTFVYEIDNILKNTENRIGFDEYIADFMARP